MLLPGRSGIAACGLLDFQDAVIGPRAFDLVSLLEDVRRDVSRRSAASDDAPRYLASNPDLTARRSIPPMRSSARSATPASSAPSRGCCCATASRAIWASCRGSGDLLEQRSRAIRRWRRSPPGSTAHLPPPSGGRSIAARRTEQDCRQVPDQQPASRCRKTAMVLAAGFGKRLRPITENAPKPLMMVVGVPMIDAVLDRLAAVGVQDVVVNLHHLAEIIENHLQRRASAAHPFLPRRGDPGDRRRHRQGAAAAGRRSVLCRQRQDHLAQRQDRCPGAPGGVLGRRPHGCAAAAAADGDGGRL